MDLEPYSVAIGRGDGLVARIGQAVIYIADQTGALPLLRALDASTASQPPGRALAKALGAIALGPDSALVPPFGVLAQADDGLLLILRGPVAANIEADGGNRTVVGDRALTWVDETLRDPVDSVTVGPRDATPTACPHSDLRAGVVPGGGFVMRPKAQAKPAAARPAPEPAAAPPAAAQPADPSGAGQPVFPPVPAPAPPAPAPTASAQITPEQRGAPTTHYDRPAPYGRQAPPKPTQQHRPPDRRAGTASPPRAEPTAEPNPDVGALTLDDEAVYPLDRPYVLGRNPMIDSAVRNSQASPIFLGDDPQISRVHTYVDIGAGALLVRDAGTPGGTFVAAPGDATWTRVGDQPTTLKPGWCVRIGQRILVYQKANSAQ
jgi:hypothetical protein